ncbi:MAG: Yip1 family protein [Chromatiaceae bacterium]
MKLIDRVKKILLQPKTEWDVIAAETATTADLYRGYIAPLAAIGPVASFVGLSLVGVNLPFAGTYRAPIGSGITTAITAYVFALAAVYVLALIVNAFATTFGGEKNQLQALKVVAYSSTPGWVAGVLQVLPMLGILALFASLYGIYLLYLGLPVLMKSPPEKAGRYTVVVVLCAIGLSILIAVLAGIGRHGAVGPIRGPESSGSTTPGSPPAFSQLDAFSQKLDSANKKMEAAQKTGDAQAQMEAATAVLGTILGGGSTVKPVEPAKLKALLPDSIAGLQRTAVDAEKNGIGGINVAKAQGTYRNDKGPTLDLAITDMGGMRAVALLASWTTTEQEKETRHGYEKTGKVDGRLTHEKFDRTNKDGTYGVVVADRFLVEARGRGVDMTALKQAVDAVGTSKLDALKHEGARQ